MPAGLLHLYGNRATGMFSSPVQATDKSEMQDPGHLTVPATLPRSSSPELVDSSSPSAYQHNINAGGANLNITHIYPRVDFNDSFANNERNVGWGSLHFEKNGPDDATMDYIPQASMSLPQSQTLFYPEDLECCSTAPLACTTVVVNVPPATSEAGNFTFQTEVSTEPTLMSHHIGRSVRSERHWDIKDAKLPTVYTFDTYDLWPNGNCRCVYAFSSERARRHQSGWAMRNTNNHNPLVLKKSCLGVLVCSNGCRLNGQPVAYRPAICDKARKKQCMRACTTPGCRGLLVQKNCRGHGGYPVTHFWRFDNNAVFFQAKGEHDHVRPMLKTLGERETKGTSANIHPNVSDWLHGELGGSGHQDNGVKLGKRETLRLGLRSAPPFEKVVKTPSAFKEKVTHKPIKSTKRHPRKSVVTKESRLSKESSIMPKLAVPVIRERQFQTLTTITSCASNTNVNYLPQPTMIPSFAHSFLDYPEAYSLPTRHHNQQQHSDQGEIDPLRAPEWFRPFSFHSSCDTALSPEPGSDVPPGTAATIYQMASTAPLFGTSQSSLEANAPPILFSSRLPDLQTPEINTHQAGAFDVYPPQRPQPHQWNLIESDYLAPEATPDLLPREHVYENMANFNQTREYNSLVYAPNPFGRQFDDIQHQQHHQHQGDQQGFFPSSSSPQAAAYNQETDQPFLGMLLTLDASGAAEETVGSRLQEPESQSFQELRQIDFPGVATAPTTGVVAMENEPPEKEESRCREVDVPCNQYDLIQDDLRSWFFKPSLWKPVGSSWV